MSLSNLRGGLGQLRGGLGSIGLGTAVETWQELRLTNPSSGALLADWWFNERGGATVADHVGSNNINLALPTSPNATWTPQGIATAAGLVQTPSIAGVRTVAFLCRTPLDVGTQAFALSGGAGSNQGLVIGTGTVPTAGFNFWLGQARGVRQVSFPIAQLNYNGAYDRGHWYVAYVEFDAVRTSILGFGGRHSATTNRFATFDIAYAAAYSGQLNDADRAQIYAAMRLLAVQRGFIIDWRDAAPAATVDYWVNMGQSNSDGRALIADLSAPDKLRTQPANVQIFTAAGFAQLTMGVNQTGLSPATYFGPQMGFAWKAEDDARRLRIGQFAVGGTKLALDGAGGWNVAQTVNAYFYQSIKGLWRADAVALATGVGLRFLALAWVHGEADSYVQADGDAYATNLSNFFAGLRTQLVLPAEKFVIAKVRNADPAYDTAANTAVRAAQVAAPGILTNTVLIDCDDVPLAADNLHYNAAGQKTLGQRLYASATL